MNGAWKLEKGSKVLYHISFNIFYDMYMIYR